jgi:hypothetical protein
MADKLTKFTEQELKGRSIGTFKDPEGVDGVLAKYRIKIATYQEEGVEKSYRSLYKSFMALLIPSDTPKDYADKYASAKCSQMMIDAYLLRGSRGEKCEIPNKVHLYEIKKESDKDGIELFDADMFEDKAGVTANEELRWIFENMRLEGVEPTDAPSIGAYSLLMHLRTNAQAMQKFYDSLWPKLLAKEDAEKTGKLEDSGKDTIELIDRLIKALPESEV